MRKILLFLLLPLTAFAQGYTSYFTGNTTNVTTSPEFGVCMMGGATEHDNAMIWLLQKANGGDVVVLRSSGSDGYNDYLYSELGVNVNSVETLVITSVAGATDPYVLNTVANAEMIWFAGGDQFNYVTFFKDNALEELINNHINVKQAPIGGTSAGMAILGSKYFPAQAGSVTSSQALNNPYHPSVILGSDDFLTIPYMNNVITDTHYDNPDRRGRQTSFIARFKEDLNTIVKGIGCNEYVAVCFGTDGRAYVYGDYPNYPEFAFFIAENCNSQPAIETCDPGVPLTWNNDAAALQVYKIPGTMNGMHYFDLSNWYNGNHSGGSWENWWAINGVLNTAPSAIPNCTLSNNEFSVPDTTVYPNPFADYLSVEVTNSSALWLLDMTGKCIKHVPNYNGEVLDTSNVSPGVYILKTNTDGKFTYNKIIKN